MGLWRRIIHGIVAIVLMSGVAFAQQTDVEETLRLDVDITDGSRVIGIPSISSVPIRTPYGEIEIPLTDIVSIRIKDEGETASLNLGNGDKLSGLLRIWPLRIETLFGEVSIPPECVKSIRVFVRGRELPASFKKGLIAYYPFNGNAEDESGKENHGQIHGATLTEDRHGNANSAYSFDGDDHIFAPTVGQPQQASWTAWFRTDHDYSIENEYGSQRGAIVVGAGVGGFYIVGPENLAQGRLEVGRADFQNIHSDRATNDGQWVFVALTYDKKELTFFVNGAKAGTHLDSDSIDYDGDGLWIGRLWYSDFGSFYGDIDEVRVYDRALSQTEIKDLYDLSR